MASDPSKTEKATPKRIREARKKGNVAKSQEISKAVSILAGLIALSFWIGYIGTEMQNIFKFFLSLTPSLNLSIQSISELAITLSLSLAKMVLPVMLTIFLFVWVALRLQVGKLWSTEVFTPKLSKFNPLSGLKRMFLSAQTFIRLGKSILQAIVIGYAPYLVVKQEMPRFPELYYSDAEGVAVYILTVGSKMAIYALIPMLVIASVDLWYSFWEYAENLKMTKDEVKDEHKQQEGDPLVKNKMRQQMMKMASKRQMQQVPTADVVITNPTHIAVALRYNAMEAPAPLVVAIGVNAVAERIKKIARENNVPVRENKTLARALYKQTEVGDVIPADLFQAVAVVLAQIWKHRPPKHSKLK